MTATGGFAQKGKETFVNFATLTNEKQNHSDLWEDRENQKVQNEESNHTSCVAQPTSHSSPNFQTRDLISLRHTVTCIEMTTKLWEQLKLYFYRQNLYADTCRADIQLIPV